MRLGIDLGGTKIAAIVLDDHGRTRTSRRIASPRGDYQATISAIVDLVREIEDELGARCSVGIGMPGALSPASGKVKNANSTWLNGRPLDRDIEDALGRPVRFANDANCLALSEATDGAAAGAAVVFAVILGTGVGGGLAVAGRPIAGRNAVAGEWGHCPLPWPDTHERPGPACYCGKQGCIETYLSGPGLAADHGRSTGATLSAEEIARAAAAGDPESAASLARYIDRLARGLALIVNIVDPDVIVLGGGLSRIDALYAGLSEPLERYAFSDRVDTPIRPARHGDASGVRGAAWLWPLEGGPDPWQRS